jgi:hypothetical protein
VTLKSGVLSEVPGRVIVRVALAPQRIEPVNLAYSVLLGERRVRPLVGRNAAGEGPAACTPLSTPAAVCPLGGWLSACIVQVRPQLKQPWTACVQPRQPGDVDATVDVVDL